MYFILTKTKLSIFIPGYKLKQNACPGMNVGQLCDVRLHQNEFCATKSQAILILVFIHLSFIFRETGGFMPQLPIVCISDHLFWSALSLVHRPLAQWTRPSLDLGLLHFLIPLPVCKY